MNLFIIIIIIFASQAFPSEKTDLAWEKLLQLSELPGVDQAYCYTDSQGVAVGENLDRPVRLASVSKLITSLWALEKLGPNYTYNTKLFIKGNNLHIAGSFDPFLGNEKMFFLISQLNELGYTKFEIITFDKKIQINPDAEAHSDEYPIITRASNARNLKMYFNTKNWPIEMQANYIQTASKAPADKFRKAVQFEIRDAQYVDANPYENDPEAKILTLTSPKLYKYLKQINVQSNNYAAHTIFLQLGGEAKFENYLEQRYGKSSESIHFYTGSGLPVLLNGIRKDNYATCEIIIELITILKNLTERKGMKLEDIVAVPGSDGGTFSKRNFPADFKNSFVAKTGTLVNTSTLAGAMSTKNGISFFGIFNQTTNITAAVNVQNEMITSLMQEMGGPLAFSYMLNPFHTFEENLF